MLLPVPPYPLSLPPLTVLKKIKLCVYVSHLVCSFRQESLTLER